MCRSSLWAQGGSGPCGIALPCYSCHTHIPGVGPASGALFSLICLSTRRIQILSGEETSGVPGWWLSSLLEHDSQGWGACYRSSFQALCPHSQFLWVNVGVQGPALLRDSCILLLWTTLRAHLENTGLAQPTTQPMGPLRSFDESSPSPCSHIPL